MRSDKQKPDGYLMIRGAAEMDHKQKARVSQWLRRHAMELENSGRTYSPIFRGRIWLKGAAKLGLKEAK